MPVRLKDFGIGLAGLAIGAALSPGTVSGDAGRVLATFLGLLAAGLLPTVTLLINSMTAGGRSVQEVERLAKELQAAIDVLFMLFGCVALSVGALVSLSIQPANFMTQVPYLTTEILPRIGQSIVVSSAGLVIWRAGTIPAVMRRALEIKREIAIDEAKRRVGENVPTPESLREGYAAQSLFGQSVPASSVNERKSK